MPSATYQLFREAILSEKQITCDYQGYHRELCPIILGHTNGRERALVFLFGVRAAKACRLAAIGNVSSFRRSNTRRCAMAGGTKVAAIADRRPEEIDLGINIHVRKRR